MPKVPPSNSLYTSADTHQFLDTDLVVNSIIAHKQQEDNAQEGTAHEQQKREFIVTGGESSFDWELPKWEENPTLDDALKNEFDDLLKADEHSRTGKILKLGSVFLNAASRGNYVMIWQFLMSGFPVNYQHPDNGMTALHYAAGSRARPAVRVLLKTGQCDFLIRDVQGRLVSEMAYIYGRDPAMARLLGIKEAKQARAQGIKLTRRPKG